MPDHALGKKLACPKCQANFVVEAPSTPASETPLDVGFEIINDGQTGRETPAKPKAAKPKMSLSDALSGGKSGKARRRDDDEDEDEAPRRRSARSRDEDEDDEDDRPRRRDRSAAKANGNGSKVVLYILLGLGGMFFLACAGCGGGFYYLLKLDREEMAKRDVIPTPTDPKPSITKSPTPPLTTPPTKETSPKPPDPKTPAFKPTPPVPTGKIEAAKDLPGWSRVSDTEGKYQGVLPNTPRQYPINPVLRGRPGMTLLSRHELTTGVTTNGAISAYKPPSNAPKTEEDFMSDLMSREPTLNSSLYQFEGKQLTTIAGQQAFEVRRTISNPVNQIMPVPPDASETARKAIEDINKITEDNNKRFQETRLASAYLKVIYVVSTEERFYVLTLESKGAYPDEEKLRIFRDNFKIP
ncbi:MAG: hypothetical protein ACRC8S_13370 [Fimbriiglobus sp.]